MTEKEMIKFRKFVAKGVKNKQKQKERNNDGTKK